MNNGNEILSDNSSDYGDDFSIALSVIYNESPFKDPTGNDSLPKLELEYASSQEQSNKNDYGFD